MAHVSIGASPGPARPRGGRGRAGRYALILAGAYFALAASYILVSDRLAGGAAQSLADLERTELFKGLAFVTVTAAVILAIAWLLFRRVLTVSEELARRREALVLSERRALVGTFAATIAHDFTNLLTVVTAAADELQELPDLPPHARELLDNVVVSVARGTELAARLSRSGERDIGPQREVELVGSVRESLRIVKSHLKVKRLEVRFTGAGPLTAVVYPALVEQILMNLVLNAADALEGQGVIEVRVYAQSGDAVLEVHDDGPGIPEAARDRIFDAFYTTKRSGAGLGLASVRLCTEMHRGRVEVERSPLGGACVRVRLPRRPAPGQARAAS